MIAGFLKKSFVLWSIALPLLSNTLFAETSFNSFYRGAEAFGRGNTGIAKSRDIDSIFYNPASLYKPDAQDRREADLVLISPTIEATSNAPEVVNKATGDDDPEKIEVMQDVKDAPFSAGGSTFSGIFYDRFAFGWLGSGFARAYTFSDPTQATLDTTSLRGYSNAALVASYAHPVTEVTFLEGLIVGVTAKFINRTQVTADLNLVDLEEVKNFKVGPRRNTGFGWGLDLGFLYGMDLTESIDVSFGLVIHDLGDTSFSKGNKRNPLSPLRQTVDLGVAATWESSSNGVTAYIDYRNLFKRDNVTTVSNIHMGIDYYFSKTFGVSTGLNRGYATGGINIRSDAFKLYLGAGGDEVGKRIGKYPVNRYYLKFEISV